MLYAWILSKKPFKTFCAVYNFRSNWHDIKYIGEFAKQYNTDIYYYNFDLIDFLENEHPHYAKKYICGSPHFTTYMKFTDIINEGTTMYAGNFLGQNIPLGSHNIMGLYHYSVLSGKSVVPYFLSETKELAYSFKQPKEDPTNDAYLAKVSIYQQHGFPVIPQEAKYNGFEEIKNFYDSHFLAPVNSIDRIYRTMGQKSQRNFDIKFRNKYESIFLNHKYIHKMAGHIDV